MYNLMDDYSVSPNEFTSEFISKLNLIYPAPYLCNNSRGNHWLNYLDDIQSSDK